MKPLWVLGRRIWPLLLSCLLTDTSAATTWSGQSNIHPGTQRDDYLPRITITPDGTPWVFWLGIDPQEGDSEVFYSTWDGTAWSAALTVNPPNNWPDRIPQVSCSPDGSLWVLWMSPRTDNQNQYVGLVSRRVANTWTPPDTVWTDATRYTNYDFHAIGADEAWFVREANGGVSIYHHAGVVHDPLVSFVPVGATAYQPTIAVDSTGVVYVAWIHDFALQQGDPLEFVIRSGGMWGTPQTIPDGPLGNALPRITLDAANRAWIVTRASSSSPPYTGGDIWALRWGMTGWEPMIRISDAIGSPDSLQTSPTVSRIPGQNPRAVWVRHHVLRVTRYDVLTSFWDGSQWTVPELVGNLADSSYVNWPDIAQRGEEKWAVWMREPQGPPWVFNIVSVHALNETTSAADVIFATEARGDEVHVRWTIEGLPNLSTLHVFRSDSAEQGSEPPESAGRIGEFGGAEARSGGMVDRPSQGGVTVTYWLALRSVIGEVDFVGPRQVSLRKPASRTYLVGANPNPSTGGLQLRGVLGSDGPEDIHIYSVTGRLVRRLQIHGEAASGGGTVLALWDGRDTAGHPVASGIYIAKLVSNRQPAQSRVIRLVITR